MLFYVVDAFFPDDMHAENLTPSEARYVIFSELCSCAHLLSTPEAKVECTLIFWWNRDSAT
jgi:hypothetical protein